MGFQFRHDFRPRDAELGQVVCAPLGDVLNLLEGVDGVQHRYIAGAVGDGDFIGRNRKWQRAKAQHHCQQ